MTKYFASGRIESSDSQRVVDQVRGVGPEPEVNGVVVRPVPQLAVRVQPLALVPVGSVHRKPLDVDEVWMAARESHRDPAGVFVPAPVVEVIGVRASPEADELGGRGPGEDQAAAEKLRRLGAQHHVEVEERVERTDKDEVQIDVESAVLFDDRQARHVGLVFGDGQRPVEDGRRAPRGNRQQVRDGLAREVPPAAGRRNDRPAKSELSRFSRSGDSFSGPGF